MKSQITRSKTISAALNGNWENIGKHFLIMELLVPEQSRDDHALLIVVALYANKSCVC